MTLTTVVGSSGSGKTTFLNDVHKSHKCIYIRQYHNMRPYIAVTKIPNFDPSRLPYWNIYETEGTAETIKVGGTMAGEFTAGLSGGQRKLLLFELICQRVKSQSELLIVLDEPFAGVTDDFVPFIVERLDEMRKNHNVLLVTNDHVQTLTEMSDNTITVSAIDRTHVRINSLEAVDREKAIAALSVGDDYEYNSSKDDIKFFIDTEIFNPNAGLMAVAIFTIFSFVMVLLTFWDSASDSAALVVTGGSIIAFFCVNPYLLALVEWRIAMSEEAEALVHSSKSFNKVLKLSLTLILILIISLIEYGVINAVISGLEEARYWVAMITDSASMTFPLIALALYTKLPFQLVQTLGFLPFLFMIFFSTTFSPGSGLPGLNSLRYLFVRFYFWCMLEGVEDQMEGCPDDDMLVVYMILSSLLGLWIFIVAKMSLQIKKNYAQQKTALKRSKLFDDEFQTLQVTLYGEKVLRRFQHMNSTHHSKTEHETEPHQSKTIKEVVDHEQP